MDFFFNHELEVFFNNELEVFFNNELNELNEFFFC